MKTLEFQRFSGFCRLNPAGLSIKLFDGLIRISPPRRPQKQPGSWNFTPDQAPKAARQRMIRPLRHRFFLPRPRNSMKAWIRIHLFSSLSTSNQPKDLNTILFPRFPTHRFSSLSIPNQLTDLKNHRSHSSSDSRFPSLSLSIRIKRLKKLDYENPPQSLPRVFFKLIPF